jgi:hypothetical protein
VGGAGVRLLSRKKMLAAWADTDREVDIETGGRAGNAETNFGSPGIKLNGFSYYRTAQSL